MTAPVVAPTSSTDVVIAEHLAFRAALSAMARPGRRIAPGPPADLSALLAATFEPGTPAAAVGGPFPDGSVFAPVDPEDAELIVVHGGDSGGVLGAARRGSEEFPEHAAFAIYLVDDPPVGTAVTLSGPGVGPDDTAAVLPWTTAELATRAAACAHLPLGVDLLAVLTDGSLVGLPRTTAVTVR